MAFLLAHSFVHAVKNIAPVYESSGRIKIISRCVEHILTSQHFRGELTDQRRNAASIDEANNFIKGVAFP